MVRCTSCFFSLSPDNADIIGVCTNSTLVAMSCPLDICEIISSTFCSIKAHICKTLDRSVVLRMHHTVSNVPHLMVRLTQRILIPILSLLNHTAISVLRICAIRGATIFFFGVLEVFSTPPTATWFSVSPTRRQCAILALESMEQLFVISFPDTPAQLPHMTE